MQILVVFQTLNLFLVSSSSSMTTCRGRQPIGRRSKGLFCEGRNRQRSQQNVGFVDVLTHSVISALDSAAVLAASWSYFFICGILYLFRASPILTQSWHEDLPMNFMQVECHCPKGSSDFPVQERCLYHPYSIYLVELCMQWHHLTTLDIFFFTFLWKPKYLMFNML